MPTGLVYSDGAWCLLGQDWLFLGKELVEQYEGGHYPHNLDAPPTFGLQGYNGPGGNYVSVDAYRMAELT